jgi:glycosyltransferase involved in cell wall biosynthesis
MNICIVSCVFPPEPVVSSEISYSLTEEISKNNKVLVICPPASRPLGFRFSNVNNIGFSNAENVSFNRVNSFAYSKSNPIGRLIEGMSFGLHSYRFIRKNKKNIDKVYMNTWPLFGQFGVALACKKSKIQYIVHVQDIYPESLVNKLPKYLSSFMLALLMPIEKFVLRNATKIIVISHYMELQIFSRGKIQKNRISIVNNWQDDKIFELSAQGFIENKNLTFMYLGNIGPVANIPLIIQTFFESKINARLIIAGFGSKKMECENLVKTLGIINIDFLDVPAGAVPQTQAIADILILPTIKNGAKSSIPSKLPAYMFSKKPIFAILDKGTDTYNAIIESKSGWVVNPEEKGEIIEQFKVLAQIQKSQLLKMGHNGYRYAKENFSKEKNLNSLTNIIISK